MRMVNDLMRGLPQKILGFVTEHGRRSLVDESTESLPIEPVDPFPGRVKEEPVVRFRCRCVGPLQSSLHPFPAEAPGGPQRKAEEWNIDEDSGENQFPQGGSNWSEYIALFGSNEDGPSGTQRVMPRGGSCVPGDDGNMPPHMLFFHETGLTGLTQKRGGKLEVSQVDAPFVAQVRIDERLPITGEELILDGGKKSVACRKQVDRPGLDLLKDGNPNIGRDDAEQGPLSVKDRRSPSDTVHAG